MRSRATPRLYYECEWSLQNDVQRSEASAVQGLIYESFKMTLESYAQSGMRVDNMSDSSYPAEIENLR
jgi:hypothetical protein